jgi:hypothetical protein
MARNLDLWWHAGRGDNFTTSSAAGAKSAADAGYQRIRTEGQVLESPAAGTIPLKLFWSDARQDNFTTSSAVGEQQALAAGYVPVRIEGHVFDRRPAGSSNRLRLWWHAGRGDNFLTGTPQGDSDAQGSGYAFVRFEGFAPASRTLTVNITSESTQTGKFFTVSGSGFSAISTAQFYFVPDTVPAGAPADFAYQLIEAVGCDASGAFKQRRIGGSFGFTPKGDPFGDVVVRDKTSGVEAVVTRY